MAVYGTFSSMPLADLLGWIGSTRRTGGLHVERDKISTRIYCREGRIVACSSNDPPTRLGQYLLYRGKITKMVLQEAMRRQEQTGKALGMILVEMKSLTREELTRCVTAKTEETILGLFDWEEAVFRFDEKLAPDPNVIQVNLDTAEVLERGDERREDMKRIRAVFPDNGVVLAHTDRKLDPTAAKNPMATRVYELIDGKRTLAEILLHTHGSEFLATKFLYRLYSKGLLKVADSRPVSGQSGEAQAAIERSAQQMEKGNFEAALDILDEAHRSHPGNEPLRAHLARTEAAFLDHAYRTALSPTRIPVLLQAGESIGAESLTPTEFFLLSLIREGDRRWDVKSIIWIAPMRSVDVVLALKRLLEASLIELREEEELATPRTAGGPAA
jgi:hypothetical protein